MKLLGIIEEDFINYKKISMTLEFPYCTFKCNLAQNSNVCQNSHLISYESRDYNIFNLIDKYFNNPITEAICMQGLEPFDSFPDLFEFILLFREKSNDDIVIYTGYDKYEIGGKLQMLQQFTNIIIKFGRFIPNQNSHFDPVLGVNLASTNQYAQWLRDVK